MLENLLAPNPARQFLERVVPWGTGGYVNIHYTMKAPNYANVIWRGTPCGGIDEAVRAVEFAKKKAEARDIYVCMSAQSELQVIQKKDGTGSFNVAKRDQRNALLLKSLYLDLDVELNNKSGKAYPSTQEALAALGQFIIDTTLPKPTAIVLSGSGGAHVYWVLETPITPDEWKPMAMALAEATRRTGLKCDTGCTVDNARILRVPNTKNYKNDPPSDVRLLKLDPFDIPNADMRQALTPFAGAVVVPLTPRGNPTGVNSELSSGIEPRTAPLVNLDEVAKSCGFIREAIDTGGADFSNPLWNLTTLIATFAENAEEMAHVMADGHEAYSEEETQSLFERKLREKEEKNLGWPKCSSIQNAGCDHCATCPQLVFDRSPLHLFRPQATLQALAGPQGGGTAGGASAGSGVLDDLPAGYLRGFDGSVVALITDKDGNTIRRAVCSYPLMNGWVQPEPWTLHFTTRLNPALPKETEIAIEFAQLQSKEQFARTIAGQGMTLPKLHAPQLQEFLLSWVTKLQQMKDAVVASSPFGWLVVGGKIDGFAYAGRVWGVNGDKPSASPSPALTQVYSPRGDVKPWMDMSKVITDAQRPPLDAILASAFAAPLVRFTGMDGLMLSAYSSGSGKGKSTALATAMAVWGSPKRSKQGLDDTINFVSNKVGQLNNLPIYWDEIKGKEATDRFVTLAFRIADGKDKSRMGADTQLRVSGTWQTLLLSCSNDSLLDTIIRQTKTTTAGLYRVFEFLVPPAVTPSTYSAGAVTRMTAELNDNYGQIGLQYAQFLGRNHAQIARDVAKLQDDLIRECNALQDERYWIASMTVLLMGARYANELGWTAINEQAFKEFLLDTLDAMREERENSMTDLTAGGAVSSVLQQYLNMQRARNTIVTDHVWMHRGRCPSGHVQIKAPTDRLDAVYVHVGIDDRVIRISSLHFRQWCQDRGLSPHIILTSLKEVFGAVEGPGRIASGTPFAGMQENLITVNLADAQMVGFTDYEGVNDPANTSVFEQDRTA